MKNQFYDCFIKNHQRIVKQKIISVENNNDMDDSNSRIIGWNPITKSKQYARLAEWLFDNDLLGPAAQSN